MDLTELDHRPWPLPRRPWVMAMQWWDLLFMHWPLDPALIEWRLPPGLELDCFEGRAWIAVVPFRMAGVTPRAVPPLPWISAFPELNVRTYVTIDGKPGVWFFSLDAGNPLAVEGARDVFHLPYYNARMGVAAAGEGLVYSSTRTDRGAPPAALEVRYQPTGPVYRSVAGTLEHWLTERYCLYAADRRGRLWRGDIHHSPWPLQPATAEIAANAMLEQIGLPASAAPSLLHFARRIDVAAWLPSRVR